MKTDKQKPLNKRMLVLHPFFLAAYPPLFLLAFNIDQIAPVQVARPLLITLSMALVLLVLFSGFTRNYQQGGLSAFLILVLFFSYGHVFNLLRKYVPGLANHLFLGIAWMVLLSVGMLLKWKIKNPRALTRILNIITGILLVLPVFNIAIYLVQSGGRIATEHLSPLESLAPAGQTPGSDLPDIYYIIVDGHGRSDVVQELFEVDNSEFIDNLEEQGFIVAGGSRSNYVQTALSLAASLNLEYVNYLEDSAGEDYRNRDPLGALIQHSRLRAFLEDRGYQTVAFSTAYAQSTLTDADVFISYDPQIINDLESMLLLNSATRMLEDRMMGLFRPFNCQMQRGGVLNIFDNLKQIPELPGPQFVFAHIMSPHPPFVFSSNGDPVNYGDCNGLDAQSFPGSRSDYQTGYSQQLIYIDRLLLETVDLILANSEIAPIVVIQGDHGSGMLLDLDSMQSSCLRERTAILNAYYLPGIEAASVYDTISPVNSFRVILNEYFGTDLPLLADRSYFSTWDQPYDFIDITDKIEAQCQSSP